jgi:hypothetical protein
MDTLMQMAIVCLSNGNMENLKQPYVPTFIDRITVSGGLSTPTGQSFQVAAETKMHGFREINSTVLATTDEENFVQLEGIKCLAIASASSNNDSIDAPRHHCSTVVWQPDVDLINKASIHDELRAAVKPLPRRLNDFEFLAYYYYDRVLSEVSEAEVESMLPHG